MAATEPSPQIKQRPRNDPTYDVDPGRGWILFASIMLLVVGALNLIYGIAAISDSQFYAKGIQFVFGSLHTWGWITTIVGAIQMAVAYGVFANTEWGRWGGILAACASMIVHFLSISSHPVLSIMAFFVNVIIIWGLYNYGGSDRYSLAG